jgi:hypothetical protein
MQAMLKDDTPPIFNDSCSLQLPRARDRLSWPRDAMLDPEEVAMGCIAPTLRVVPASSPRTPSLTRSLTPHLFTRHG